jgi:hypothetical protein
MQLQLVFPVINSYMDGLGKLFSRAFFLSSQMMLGQANYLGSEFLGMVIACQRNSFLMEVISGLLDQVLMRARGILRPEPVVMTLIASKPKVCWLTKTAILLAS